MLPMKNKRKKKVLFQALMLLCCLLLVAYLAITMLSSSAAAPGEGNRFLSARQQCTQRFSAYVRSPQLLRDLEAQWEDVLPGYAKYENIDIAFREDHQPLQHTFAHGVVTDRVQGIKLYEHWFGNIFDEQGRCKPDFAAIPREFLEALSRFRTNILYKRMPLKTAAPPLPPEPEPLESLHEWTEETAPLAEDG